MAGPRSPVLLHHLDKVVGFLVFRSGFSFLVPVPSSSFRFLVPVPRSGFSFLVPVLTYRFITNANKENHWKICLLHLTNNVYGVYDILCMFMKFAEP